MKKKIIPVLIFTLILISALVFVACGPSEPSVPGPGPGPKPDNNGIVNVLPDMVAYGDNSSNYNVPVANYGADKATQAEKLAEKQTEEIAEKGIDTDSDGKNDVLDNADEDITTFTKIFCASDPETIIDRMSVAGLAKDMMIELVGYITRKDSGAMPSDPAQFGYEIGTTSAIRDYEELDKLYELYDEADEENEDFYYEKLQLKKRKVIGEVVKIFGDDGAAFARTATEELSYAYQVVEEMVEKHNVDNETDYDFKNYFKTVFFDYETLVYFLAFEETVALNKSTFAATNRKNITTLYGYYYQYEKADYECMTDAQYKEYLKLSMKDEKTDAEALKYTEYDRTHYAKAYRYSADCYKKYYTEHFQFQARQEKYDKTVYTGGSVINGKEIYANGIGNAISGNSITYSSEMMQGLQVGMAATLKISDVNYEYTGVDANVTRYNKYYNDYQNRSSSVADKIKIVRYEKEQLSSQYNTITHKTISSADLSNALKYQIKSYSGDYIRAIQSYKKEDVILNEELKRLAADGLQTGDAEYDEKLEEIGRNRAMLPNLTSNWTSANIDSQMTSANSVEWKSENSTTGATIESEMKAALAIDYETYHQKNQGANAVYVDEYFEKNLIKKKWSCGGTDNECKNENGHLNCSEEYDTSCKISRLLNNHDKVFRHAAGQVEISYQKVDVSNYEIEKVEASGYSHIAGPNGTPGTLSKDAKIRPIQTAYTDGQKDTYQSDEYISLPEWRGGGQGTNGWLTPTQGDSENPARLPALPQKGTGVGTSFTMVNGGYTYYFEFVGWYIDTDLKYEVRANEDTFGYDIKLYPGYKINKVRSK